MLAIFDALEIRQMTWPFFKIAIVAATETDSLAGLLGQLFRLLFFTSQPHCHLWLISSSDAAMVARNYSLSSATLQELEIPIFQNK